jgi:hypothetical protein
MRSTVIIITQPQSTTSLWAYLRDHGTRDYKTAPPLPLKANHYFTATNYPAERDVTNRLSGEAPHWTGIYLPLYVECWGFHSVKGCASSSIVTQAINFRCHGGRYHRIIKDQEQADVNKHCPLCYADDFQEHFFLHCKYNIAEECRGRMERDLLALYKDLRFQYADKPDLNDLAVELRTDMRSTINSRHRYLVLLGHWTEPLRATLMDKLWVE